MQSHFVLWSSELCCSLLFTQWCFLLQLFSEDWKTPLNGILWVVHSNYPLLAKLLIEGIRSRAAPPSPGCDRRTGSSAAKSRASDSESCFCHVRLWGFKCTAALVCVCVCVCTWERARERAAALTQGFHQHCYSQPWPLQAVQMSRKPTPGWRLHFCQLSVEWHRKGKPNHCRATNG